MNKMQKAIQELAEMDELAARSSPIHALHPAAKLIATVAYILFTLSFGKYDLSGLVPMALWPILLFQISGIEELFLQAAHRAAARDGGRPVQSVL